LQPAHWCLQNTVSTQVLRVEHWSPFRECSEQRIPARSRLRIGSSTPPTAVEVPPSPDIAKRTWLLRHPKEILGHSTSTRVLGVLPSHLAQGLRRRQLRLR